ncbi:hypothetical protein EYF80_015996 [Liparis tanakae]|uniref:Uncharacterized protein n=1 Tax=Liparis tanakae TaxID=230148 RepID=A0A4Z2I763_9TELE|nr:hypothetical protein EYF80_015996 [Liparis tanakae]
MRPDSVDNRNISSLTPTQQHANKAPRVSGRCRLWASLEKRSAKRNCSCDDTESTDGELSGTSSMDPWPELARLKFDPTREGRGGGSSRTWVKDGTTSDAVSESFFLPRTLSFNLPRRDLDLPGAERLTTACPSSLSGPTSARCRTWTRSVARSLPPASWCASGGRSKAASSRHAGATLFSTTEVWNFSLPTCMTAYASFVPPFPLILRPRACCTVTWTLTSVPESTRQRKENGIKPDLYGGFHSVGKLHRILPFLHQDITKEQAQKRRQVPNAADDGPTAHHPQQITHQAELTAVPESIPKPRIVLQEGRKARSSPGKSNRFVTSSSKMLSTPLRQKKEMSAISNSGSEGRAPAEPRSSRICCCKDDESAEAKRDSKYSRHNYEDEQKSQPDIETRDGDAEAPAQKVFRRSRSIDARYRTLSSSSHTNREPMLCFHMSTPP